MYINIEYVFVKIVIFTINKYVQMTCICQISVIFAVNLKVR